MAKIDLNTVSSGYLSQAALNANFTAIEDEFQNKVLYRDNPSGEPNSMQTHLDMNGYHVLNAGNPSLMDADNIAYTADATGAETRTIAEKLNDVVSVKDFGAVGDGVTDDTAAIQAALTAGSAAQRPVWLPTGTYKVSSRLIVPTKTGLVSDGSATIYATAAGFSNTSLTNKYVNNSAVIDLSGQIVSPFTPADGQIIRGIRLISEVSDARFVDGIVARNCTNLQIVENEVAYFPASRAICLASVIGAEISRNWIHDCTTNYTGWSPSRPQITGVEVDNDRVNSVYSTRVGIRENRITDLTVGAAVLAYAGYETDGINLAGNASGGNNTNNISVCDNIIRNVGEGVDSFALQGLISNNTITNTYNFGIKLIHGASENVIQGNQIFNTGIAGIVISGSDSAGVGNTKNNLVSGNVVENVDYLGVWAAGGGTGLSGIKINNSTSTFVPQNNLIIGNLLDGSSNYGIITGQASNNNVFSNNRITAAPAIAYIYGSETSRVTDAVRTNVRTHRVASQNIPATTATKVQFNTVGFDARSEFDTTNNRWVCQIPGLYRVKGAVRFGNGAIPTGTYLYISIYKNNSPITFHQTAAIAVDQTHSVDDLVLCVPGDYLEIFYYHAHSSAHDITGNTTLSFFSVSQE